MKRILHITGTLLTVLAGVGITMAPMLSTNQKIAGIAALLIALCTQVGSAVEKVESTLPIFIGLLWTATLLSSCGCATLSGSDAGQAAKSATIDCTNKTVASLATLGSQGVVAALQGSSATQSDLKTTAESDAVGWIVCVALEFGAKCVSNALTCDVAPQAAASAIVAKALSTAAIIPSDVPLIATPSKPVSTVSPYPGNWLESERAIYQDEVTETETLYKSGTITVGEANVALCLENIGWQSVANAYLKYLGMPPMDTSVDQIAACRPVL